VIRLRPAYRPALVGVGCGCANSPRPVESAEEAAALAGGYSDEDRKRLWLSVGGEPRSESCSRVGEVIVGAGAAVLGVLVAF